MTIDLRGLGPAVRARAKARHLTVAAMARRAVIAMLESSDDSVEEQPEGETDLPANQMVKVTVRLRHSIAHGLSTRARDAGLSQGSYLTTLIEGAPAPPLAVDHKNAVTALGVSTDQIAAISADLNEFIRLVRRGTTPSATQFGDRTRTLADDVRRHLAIASQLMAELKPAAAGRDRTSTRARLSQRVNS